MCAAVVIDTLRVKFKVLFSRKSKKNIISYYLPILSSVHYKHLIVCKHFLWEKIKYFS